MSELLPVYDRYNTQTNVYVPINLVHQEGYIGYNDGTEFHRHVFVYLIRGGEILMQKRSPLKERYPEAWTASVSGHVSMDETPVRTAIRETYEELGIKTDASDLKFMMATKQTTGEYAFNYIYTLDYYKLNPPYFEVSSDEVIGLSWMDISKVITRVKNNQLVFTPGFLNTFKTFLRFKRFTLEEIKCIPDQDG